MEKTDRTLAETRQKVSKKRLKESSRPDTEKRRKSKSSSSSQPSASSAVIVSKPFLVGVLCGTVACVLAWKLAQAPFTTEIDVTGLNASLRDTLVAQSAAVGSLIAHLQRAHATHTERLDLLALGPAGTGKTLMLQTVCASVGVPCWRLVGDIDFGTDTQLLDKLAVKLAKSASRSAWLLLAFDHVSALIPQVVYLTDAVSKAIERQEKTLVVVVAATSSDAGGDSGVEAERMAFRHANVLRFRPMRRAEVSACVRRYMRERKIIILDDEVQDIVNSVKYEGQYAVHGCKPAIYQLEVSHDMMQK